MFFTGLSRHLYVFERGDMLDSCVGELVCDSLIADISIGCDVIRLTRLNGTEFYLNPELIQSVEKTPDTVITLINDKKLVVRESPEVIRERYIEYRQRITQPFYVKQDR